ncbi:MULTISPECIES: AzlC family ABC transporter permease [Bacillaceae]|uniref:AzlC family ABC transporter permease n=1 Tax=Evansella alkalicola TaxID=745819 RepID=A0ABS6JUQ7_9BACI|nr:MULTISPECIES: AzlC family ABC transporter permease [Bacillaceae]MBU9721831.1 AzlC family ABC transporter permease [Bacillus alkalicola]
MENVTDTYENLVISPLKKGLLDGIPIAIGYMPVALTFGLIAGSTGLAVSESVLMSMIVFAGASQYMALSMIAVGSTALEIIAATFIVNFRHLLMSASIHERAEKSSKKMRALYAFGLTDEVFAVASTKTPPIKPGYILGTAIMAYTSWVSFTAVGFFAGAILPWFLQESMAIALYALFIALLIPSIKKEGKIVIILALLGGLFHVFFAIWLSTGWAIMFATIAAVSVYELTERFVLKGDVTE